MATCFASAATHAGGIIVVAHDDWTLSNTGYASPNDPGVFALNVARLFKPSGPGRFLVYSNNFGYAQTSLSATMTGAGHTWLISTSQSFTVANLLTFDGVFIGGFAANAQVLTDYVNAGGHVYILGGAGGLSEATWYNPFLTQFGLQFASNYNGLSGSLAITNSHPLFVGVDHLYQNNGSTITDTQPADPRSQILITQNGQGIYAIYNADVCGGTPTGDMNASGRTDGNDIPQFVAAAMAMSTNAGDVCKADFSGNGVVDPADVPGFVAKMLNG